MIELITFLIGMGHYLLPFEKINEYFFKIEEIH